MTNRVQATGPESAELAALLKRADEALTDPAWNRSNELEADLIRDLVARLRAATAAGEAKPVAWKVFLEFVDSNVEPYGVWDIVDERPGEFIGRHRVVEAIPLYTAPPEQGWREDALRYRFFRKVALLPWEEQPQILRESDPTTPEDVDAMFDAAMKSPQGDKP
jgi:hypothetical protein